METDNQRRERETWERSQIGSSDSPKVMVGAGRTPDEAMRNARVLDRSGERDLEKAMAETFTRMDDRVFGGPTPPGYEDITLKNIDQVFRYQTWNPDQAEAGDIVREALIVAGKAILRHVPPGGFRDEAIKLLVDTRMKANAAISFNGRF